VDSFEHLVAACILDWIQDLEADFLECAADERNVIVRIAERTHAVIVFLVADQQRNAGLCADLVWKRRDERDGKTQECQKSMHRST
jgi:hypothetical protein